jgi:CubicO group peptidase (beta-lactamase class C family)
MSRPCIQSVPTLHGDVYKPTQIKKMKRTYLVVVFIAGTILTSTCVAQKKAAAPQQFNYNVDLKKGGVSPQKVASVDSLLQSFVDQKKVSSVVGFVAKGGNVVYKKAFGWKDVENKIPATPDDYYILFSQTKAVTTVAFMTLVEKGLVKIDDPVSKYFPEIPDRVATSVRDDGTFETRPVSTPMTFIHLMSHTSGLNAGLVGKTRRIERQKADSIRKVHGDTSASRTMGQRSGGPGKWEYLKDAMHDLVKYPLGFDPGSEYSYHVSTNMLAYMIERISGKSLREYVKESVLEPLGMNHTDWYYEPTALSHFVKAYNAVDGKLEPASNMFSEGTISKDQTYAEGAIGLNGPIEDYAKFCQMLLNRGEFNGRRILKPETIDLMTKVNRLPETNAGGNGFQFGLGFELYNEKRKPVPEVSNTAFAWGGLYGTAYIVDPANNLVALFYLNMPKHEDLYPLFLTKAYQVFRK